MFSRWKLKIVVLQWSRTPVDSGKKPEQVPPCCGVVLSAQLCAQLHHYVDSREVLLRPMEDLADKPFAAISIYRPGKGFPARDKTQTRMGKVVVSYSHHEQPA